MNPDQMPKNSQRDEEEQFDGDACKLAVNELLWEFLPRTTTICEADDIAMRIVSEINREWIA